MDSVILDKINFLESIFGSLYEESKHSSGNFELYFKNKAQFETLVFRLVLNITDDNIEGEIIDRNNTVNIKGELSASSLLILTDDSEKHSVDSWKTLGDIVVNLSTKAGC